MQFTKMHGLGNDFIILDQLRLQLSLSDEQWRLLARQMCDRHFGIGADGLILVLPAQAADLRMRIFNSDGSEAEMCGNGIRCFAVYARESGYVQGKALTVETLAGIKRPQLTGNGEVRVNMGQPVWERDRIPMLGPPGEVLREKLTVEGTDFTITAVSMGNPHCVIQVPDLQELDFARWGPRISSAAEFPRGTNVEFVQVVDRQRIKMKVWERGAGATLACGTGACAAAVACSRSQSTERSVEVELPGGKLKIDWSLDGDVYMTGPAAKVFTGAWNPGN